MTVTALLGPTNTGKTHRAIERMLEHESAMIGLPLRLLAREVYDRITAKVGERRVALVTGEEKRVPQRPAYWVCTVESMPLDVEVDFLCVDEIQLAAHRQRGHTFTDRLLHSRGTKETWFLGADTMRSMLEELVPVASVARHPRLSQLTYTGAHSLAALPARTAVVAFSADGVYELAERLRRRHGGTAVVLGALSPRTRNAQVAMYQAGEVNHLVATDAIGMGLNMDVERVVFASLEKYDGREVRPLDVSELAQIAGRAGRYTTDGGFGVLRPLEGLSPRVVDAVERHRFPQVRRVVWRSRDLDFSSLSALIGSLRARPKRRALRLVEQADDYEALTRLSKLPDLAAKATSPETIELLWDVCRIPDFRKLLLDSHVQLLAAIFEQLTSERGRIDSDWMAGRIGRLRSTEGDIPTLMSRIAFIRTWTYITNHAAWVQDAEHWQGVTRQIEDEHSDALHERLTERFVDAPVSEIVGIPAPRRKVRAKRKSARDEDAIANSPFSSLLALEHALPDAAGGFDEATSTDRWVEALVEAPHEAIGFDDDLRLTFQAEAVGRLRKGADLLHPQIVVRPRAPVGAGAQQRIERRLTAWLRDAVGDLLAPLPTDDDLGPHARGIVYQLKMGLGTISRKAAADQLRQLRGDDRKRLEAAGVVIGRRAVFVPAMAKHVRARLRAALWRAQHEGRAGPPLPMPGAVSVAATAEQTDFYEAIGFVRVGPRAIRQDQLERALDRLATLGAGPFELPPEIGAWIGCGRRPLTSVLSALGYRREDGEVERWRAPQRGRGRGRRRGRQRAGG